MNIEPARLEEWMRTYYFETAIDIGSSGVRNFSLRELRQFADLTPDDLDDLVFNDGHSLGSQPLRRQIARCSGTGDPERVMVTHGSSEAIYLLMHVLLRPGDEVVVLDPAYYQLYSCAQAIGCRLVRWPLRFAQRFAPDLAELGRLLTPRTRMVVVNFPHNPTGTSMTAAQQDTLVAMVADAGAYLVWDGAFAELVYEGTPLPVPSARYERCVSTGTLSKAYGLAGLRVGWCLAAPDVLERCVKLRDHMTLHLSPLVELIATRALEHRDALVARRLAEARTNLDRLSQWVDAHAPLVDWVRPQGGVCTLLRLNHVPDVTAFCHQLARDYRVLVVPGVCFDQPECVRVGFGGSASTLDAGLAWLSECLTAVAMAPL